MMLFQRRLFLELMGNAVTTVFLLMLILLLITSVQVVSSIDGISLAVFARTVPMFLGVTVNIVMPIAVLVAVVLTYGRAAADNEVDTLRASGVHPFHVLTPGLVFGALMSVLMLVAMDDGRPFAERAKRRITKSVDPGALIAQKLASGEPEELVPGLTIDPPVIDEQGVLHDLRLQWTDTEGFVVQEIVAETARMFVDRERDLLVLRLGRFRTVKGEGLDGKDEGTEIVRALPREFGDLNVESLTTTQLLAWLERPPGKRGIYKRRNVEAEVAMRTSSATACFLFVLLGYPVALRFRRSDRVGAFLVAFLLALFLYYPSVKVSSALASSGTVPPAAAAWIGHALLLAASLVLARRGPGR